MKERGWKIALAVGVCVFLAVVAGIAWYGYPIFNNPFNDARFDRAVWLSGRGNINVVNLRGPMAEDLQRRFLHKGMTRRQVESVIGKPDSWDRYYRGVDLYALIYSAAPEGASEYYPERGTERNALSYLSLGTTDPRFVCLGVCYDKRGRLIRTKIVNIQRRDAF